MINERNNLINEYEKKMEETLQEHRKKFNEREATSNLKIEELLKQITELKNLNKNMKNDYDKKLKEDNESQLIKFKELEFFLKKNVDEINKKNEKLEKNIEEAKNNERKKMRLIENEHEAEFLDYLVRYTSSPGSANRYCSRARVSSVSRSLLSTRICRSRSEICFRYQRISLFCRWIVNPAPIRRTTLSFLMKRKTRQSAVEMIK